jgi:hypothetical protein
MATVLIDHYYDEIGLDQGWHPERLVRLSTWLKATPFEVGKLCCLSFNEVVKKLASQEKFSRPVSLHFRMLEAWYLERKFGHMSAPIMPVHLLHPKEF